MIQLIGATDVALDHVFTFRFSEAIQFGSGTITLRDSTGAVVEQIQIGGSGTPNPLSTSHQPSP